MKLANLVTACLLKELNERTQSIILPNFHMVFEESNTKWECDLFQLTDTDWTIEYEVKTTKADLRNDFNKTWHNQIKTTPKKHDFIINGKRTNRFYFVIPESFIEDKELIESIPNKYGIIAYSAINPNNISEGFAFRYYRKAGVLHKNKIGTVRNVKQREFVEKTAIIKYNFLYIKYTRRETELLNLRGKNILLSNKKRVC